MFSYIAMSENNSKPVKQRLNTHPVLFLASVIIIIAGVQAVAPVLNILLLALLLAVSVLPALTWLLKRGWSKALALTITILLVVVISLGMAAILGLAINNMAGKVPTYKERVSALFGESVDYLDSRGIDMSDIKSLDFFSPEKVVSYGSGFVEGIFSTLGNFLFVMILMIFIVSELEKLNENSEKGKYGPDSWQTRFSDIAHDLKTYVSINAMTGLMTGVADFVLLLALGVDFAIMWGFLAFLFSFIPNIGFILSVLPPALIALLEYSWLHAVIVIAGFVIINAIIDNIVRPKFLGDEFNMSLLTIFLSLLFWAWVLGPIGAILGVPLTMAAKKLVVCMNEDIENQHNPPEKPPDDTDTPAREFQAPGR